MPTPRYSHEYCRHPQSNRTRIETKLGLGHRPGHRGRLVGRQASRLGAPHRSEIVKVFATCCSRSLDGARRNPGIGVNSLFHNASAMPSPDSAALHPGYIGHAPNIFTISVRPGPSAAPTPWPLARSRRTGVRRSQDGMRPLLRGRGGPALGMRRSCAFPQAQRAVLMRLEHVLEPLKHVLEQLGTASLSL